MDNRYYYYYSDKKKTTLQLYVIKINVLTTASVPTIPIFSHHNLYLPVVEHRSTLTHFSQQNFGHYDQTG